MKFAAFSKPSIDVVSALRANDWLLIGAYSYFEKKYVDNILNSPLENPSGDQYQFEILRFMDEGYIARFQFHRGIDKNKPPVIYTVTFDKASATRYGIKESKGTTYLEFENYGEKEYHPIVRFDGNLLIYDITKSGKLNDRKSGFRQVYLAVPRKFQFSQ